MPFKPTDRCACSNCAGPVGCAQCCCGPPIWMAVRGLCITNLVIDVLGLAGSVLALSFGDCNKMNADGVEIAFILISLIGIGFYSWGISVAHSKSASQGQLLFHIHIGYKVVAVLIGFCRAGNFSRSPREKDANFAAACLLECIAEDRPAGPFGGGCTLPSSTTIGPAVGGAAWTILLTAYWAYIIWSFVEKVKDGSVDATGGMTVVMAPQAVVYGQATVVPMGVAVATAVPVQPVYQAQAVPVAGAQMAAPPPPPVAMAQEMPPPPSVPVAMPNEEMERK